MLLGFRSITNSKPPALHEVEKWNGAGHRFYSFSVSSPPLAFPDLITRLSKDISGCRSFRPTPSSFESNGLWKVVHLTLLPFLPITTWLRWIIWFSQLTPGAMQLGVFLHGGSNRSCFHLLLSQLSRWYTPVNFCRPGAQSCIQGDFHLTVPAISNSCDLPGMHHRYGGDLLKELQEERNNIPLVVVLESNYIAFWKDNLVFLDGVMSCRLSFTPLNLFQ